MAYWGQIRWHAEDVQTLRDDLTTEQARAFLERNEKHLRDRMIEVGWEVMQTLLDIDDEVPPPPNENEREKGDDDGQEYGDPRDHKEGRE